ncbi:MAG: hypothetical protein RSG22_08345 [Comamonas sp.]
MHNPIQSHDSTPRMLWRHTATATLFAVASLFSLSAHAANVDLVTNIELTTPSQPATTYAPYDLRLRFANNNNVATNAVGTVQFPANLSDITITAAPGNAASCPAASSFQSIPTGPTTGSESMSLTLPELPAAQTCGYTLRVTPLVAGSAYLMASTIQTGSGDTELVPATNRSENPFSALNGQVALKVEKSISKGVSGIDNSAAYGQPIEFTVVYTNQSATPVSLGATESLWVDFEGSISPQIRPSGGGSSGGKTSCSSSVATSAICSALDFSGAASSTDTDTTVFQSNFSHEVMEAGESITIKYWRQFSAPQCGKPFISNIASWYVMADGLVPTWADGNDSAVVDFSFPASLSTSRADCTPLPLTWGVDKTLKQLLRNGQPVVDTAIRQDGDEAVYELTIDLSGQAADASGRTQMNFNIYDMVLLATGTMPQAMPANAMQVEMRWISCAGAVSSTCPSGVIQPFGSLMTPSASHNVSVPFGTRAVFELGLRFKLASSFQCLVQTDGLQNEAAFTVSSIANDGYTFSPAYKKATTAALQVFPEQPYCVNLHINKSVSPMVVKDLNTPVSFDLQFSANTAPAGPRLVSQAEMTDRLGPAFKATAATCSLASGKAQVPAGSLMGNISAANEFKVVVTDMERDAVVKCTMTGLLQTTGSFQNSATIKLASPEALLNDGSTIVQVNDYLPQDNTAVVNYMTEDAPRPTPAPVPVNNPWLLALLCATLASLGWRMRKA